MKCSHLNRVAVWSAVLSSVNFAALAGEAPLTTSKLPAELTPEHFAKTLALIKPQPGESQWAEIPWFLSVHDARIKAAAEGKPIFIWSSGGALPLGTC